MIDWSVANPALVALFTRLAFDKAPDKFRAQVDGRAQRYTDTESKTDLVLKLRHISPIGVDETEKVEVGSGLHYAQSGNRRVIIEVRVETYKNNDANWAWTTIERLRTRIQRPSSHQALADINFAFVEAGPSVGFPQTVNGAEWSVAAMDITFGTRFIDVETIPFGWFERIAITSHIEDVDGQELPDPAMNFTQKLFPRIEE